MMRIIQVAGTKAKGSVSTYLANIVSAAGYKTGLFTSPHVQREEERIRIDGKLIPTADMQRLLAQSKSKGYYRKFFDACMAWFAENEVEVAIMETGMGGRYDPVTKLEICETVLTRIGMDHMDVLGDTIEQITLEKATTIPQDGYVICMPQPQAALRIIESTCSMMNARLVMVDEADITVYQDGSFDFGEYADLRIKAIGGRQKLNAATAVAAARALYHVGVFINVEHMREGLMHTSLPARQQYIAEKNILVDGAHNVDSLEFLNETLQSDFANSKKVFLVAAMDNKDVGLLSEVADGADVFITAVDDERAMDITTMKETVFAAYPKEKVHEVQGVKQAYERARAFAKEQDAMLVVTGSLYLAGEVLDLLDKQ